MGKNILLRGAGCYYLIKGINKKANILKITRDIKIIQIILKIVFGLILFI